MDAPEYSDSADFEGPTIKLPAREMGPVPGHADSSQQWTHRSTATPLISRAPPSSSRPERWVPSPVTRTVRIIARRRSTGTGLPGIKLDGFEMGPIPATRTSPNIASAAVQKFGPTLKLDSFSVGPIPWVRRSTQLS